MVTPNNGREAPVILRNLDQSPTQPAPRAGRGARPPHRPASRAPHYHPRHTRAGSVRGTAVTGRGRPPDDRPAIARSLVVRQSRAHHPHHIGPDRAAAGRSCTATHRCGWERRSEVPSEATFSRAFAEFAAQNLPERVHEQLVRRHLRDHIIGHISRDATEIEAREKPCRRSPRRLATACAAQAQAWASAQG